MIEKINVSNPIVFAIIAGIITYIIIYFDTQKRKKHIKQGNSDRIPLTLPILFGLFVWFVGYYFTHKKIPTDAYANNIMNDSSTDMGLENQELLTGLFRF